MTESFFDIAFEGTSNEDCIIMSKLKEKSVIVFDKQKHYGSTFTTIEDLKYNKFVKNIKIYKYTTEFLFEIDPKFYRQNDEILKMINETESFSFCDFLPINRHYLILESGKYYKIPYSMSDLVDTKYFTFKDRHLVNKFIKSEINLEELKIKLSDKCKQILFNGIVGDEVDVNLKLEEYILNFENYPFVYPKHGLKDLSELLSRVNAVNGTSYLLDISIGVYEFKKIDCNLNEIKFKNIKQNKDINKNHKYTCQDNKKDMLLECNCNEDLDILDRFNTNNEDDSDENIEIEKVYSGKLSISDRQCCLDNLNNSSGILCYSDKQKQKDDFFDLMKFLNITVSLPRPIFFQSYNSKIKIEDITLRNQTIDFSIDESDFMKENLKKIGFNYEKLSDYISNGYKYFIQSEYDHIFVKKIYKKEITGIKKHIRILNVSLKLIKDRFFAWFYNGYEFVQVLVFDFNSKCCEKDTYIVYLIKKDRAVSNRDLEILNIHSCDILTDFSYQLWDYKHVTYY